MTLKQDTLAEIEVLKAMEHGSHTIKSLATKTGYNYYTVRAVIRDLQTRNLVKQRGFKNRSAQFIMNRDADAAKYTIPNITNRNNMEDVSAFRLVSNVANRKNTRAHLAVENFPIYVMRLFTVAYKLKHSEHKSKQLVNLQLLRKEMEADLTTLGNTFYAYQQILNNQRFWNADFMERFPDDPNFDLDQLIEAYEVIYGSDSFED